MAFDATHLGQSGVRLAYGASVLYVDPYLSDRVAAVYGDELRRRTPPPITAAEVTDASWVLVTHAHLDHCDPDTLLPIAASSPGCRFVAPPAARQLLLEWGVAANRVVAPGTDWSTLAPGVRMRSVPAAHTTVERDASGEPQFVGYLLELGDRRVYHAGDTMPHDDLFAFFDEAGPIDVALLPVNERNYFRERSGIVGNMSVREAFLTAERIRASALVPIHWDLFAPNSVYWEEIELLHRLMSPSFRLAPSLAGL